MAKNKEHMTDTQMDKEMMDQQDMPVENPPAVQEPKKERKSLKQRGAEFCEKHPVAVRRGKKIAKGLLIVGAAVAGAMLGMNEMGKRCANGEEDPDETTDDCIQYEGEDLDSEPLDS